MSSSLPNDIEKLKEIITDFLAKVDQLEAENAELRRRLGLNSENRNKPPSSDGLAKTQAFPRPKNKSIGGQKGHQGNTLKRVEHPDQIVIHAPTHGRCCGRRIEEDETELIESRQVFDLPPNRLIVTEHRVGRIYCCGRAQHGEFPATVTASVQYGAAVRALCVL